jgi:hypothetical protein
MSELLADMPDRALASWFGSDRMIGDEIGAELEGCSWVGVPFAGAMSCLDSITARTLVVSDLHRHVINLARAIANPDAGQFRALARMWAEAPYHPDLLQRAQAFCRANEPKDRWPCDPNAAYWYFIVSWMGRSSKGGSVDEFNGGIATRWNSNGGGSGTRYRSAVRSAVAWRRLMRRCDFHVLDALLFIPNCPDTPETGLYVDPPFPGPGEKYRYKFTIDQHRELARMLGTFAQARVVCRFYDHPLIRELYPQDRWTWRFLTCGRKQTNAPAPEVLIINGPSRVPAGPEANSLF